MKASPIMFLEYLGMLGVPTLLVVLAVFVLAGVTGTARTVLLLLTAADCLVYGAVSMRSVFFHGRGNRAAHTR
jgi:hypothetical protein